MSTYDTKCYDLASAFLEDEPGLFTEAKNDELAALIQRTIEDQISFWRSNYEPPDPPGFEAGFAENH